MPKNTLVTCNICGKEVPMSRKGEIQKHYRADIRHLWCKNRGSTTASPDNPSRKES